MKKYIILIFVSVTFFAGCSSYINKIHRQLDRADAEEQRIRRNRLAHKRKRFSRNKYRKRSYQKNRITTNNQRK